MELTEELHRRYHSSRANRLRFHYKRCVWLLVVGGAKSLKRFLDITITAVVLIVLAPLFALLWIRLGPRQPSTPVKFALGNVVIGLAFLLFVPWAGGTGPSTPLLAVVFIVLIFATGELLISPIG